MWHFNMKNSNGNIQTGNYGEDILIVWNPYVSLLPYLYRVFHDFRA
jgi:hypothetical protein